MKVRHSIHPFVLLLVTSLCATAWAQALPTAQKPTTGTQQQKPYEPPVGQEGKDVVWVPTPQALVDKMLDMAKVTPQDFVMDLGSGDGRTVITAAKRGAQRDRASNTTPTWSSCRSATPPRPASPTRRRS